MCVGWPLGVPFTKMLAFGSRNPIAKLAISLSEDVSVRAISHLQHWPCLDAVSSSLPIPSCGQPVQCCQQPYGGQLYAAESSEQRLISACEDARPAEACSCPAPSASTSDSRPYEVKGLQASQYNQWRAYHTLLSGPSHTCLCCSESSSSRHMLGASHTMHNASKLTGWLLYQTTRAASKRSRQSHNSKSDYVVYMEELPGKELMKRIQASVLHP